MQQLFTCAHYGAKIRIITIKSFAKSRKLPCPGGRSLCYPRAKRAGLNFVKQTLNMFSYNVRAFIFVHLIKCAFKRPLFLVKINKLGDNMVFWWINHIESPNFLRWRLRHDGQSYHRLAGKFMEHSNWPGPRYWYFPVHMDFLSL